MEKRASTSKTILVTGATGTTGGEVTRQLLEGGHRVRVLARGPEAASKLPEGAQAVIGDHDDVASLDAAFAGVEAAYAVTPVSLRGVAWMRNLIDAARRAGVRRFVKMSGMTASPDSPSVLIRDHASADEYLRASGIPYTILRPNSFMQNQLGSIGTIKAQGAFYQATGEAQQSVIDVVDVAAVAVKALTEPGHEQQTYVLTGPESLGFHEIAAKIGRTIGKPVAYVPITTEAAEQGMKGSGLPDWLAHDIAEFFGSIATGAFAGTTDDVQRVLGRPPASFDQFLARHAAMFQ
jgi:uncharacterized protein YbjT (DUF2867 family)